MIWDLKLGLPLFMYLKNCVVLVVLVPMIVRVNLCKQLVEGSNFNRVENNYDGIFG
jgi:hypothetical protein